MKVGDLVELSAYALKSRWSEWMTGLLGIVVGYGSGDYRVTWYQNGRTVHLDRKSLRHAKAEK